MTQSTKHRNRKQASEPAVEVVDITIDSLNQLMDRIEQRNLQDEDYDLLIKVIRSYDYVMALLKDDRVKLNRLKRMLFDSTEKTDSVLPGSKESDGDSQDGDAPDDNRNSGGQKPPKGHGRNGVDE